jgi:SAM-dependent methyltransferase
MSHADAHADAPQQDAAEFWESRYAGVDRAWSGRVNQVLADVARGLPPGRALELGCGEGADAIWLAEQGWQVTAVDISPTAIARGAAAAEEAGIAPGRIQWHAHDLATWAAASRSTAAGGACYDLVSANFLQSPVELPRAAILRRAADLVAPGGHLLVVSHAGFPPWSTHRHEQVLPTPEQEIQMLALPPREWEVLVAEIRSREATGPQGERATLDDSVVLLRRREQ